MRMILTSIFALMLAVVSFAQSPITDGKISLLYLRDGKANNFIGVSSPLYVFPDTDGKVKLNYVYSWSPKNADRGSFLGTTLSADVVYSYNKTYGLTVHVGAKGFNVTDAFRWQENKQGWIAGLAVSWKF